MKIGNQDITAMYVGNQPVKKVYLGSQVVWMPAAGPDLLLDLYSGSAGAWSFRQLSSSVTNVARIRRSSDNTEQDFTASEITNGTLTSFTGANDGFVVSMYDQSGNGLTASQSTAAAQPKIVSSGSLITANGKPAATFDGVNDGLVTAAVSSIPDNVNGLSLFLTVKNTDDGFTFGQYNPTISKRVWSSNVVSVNTGRGTYSFSVQVADTFQLNSALPEVDILAQVNVLTGMWFGADTKCRSAINGAAFTLVNSSTPAISSVSKSIEIGSISDESSFSAGDFMEAIIYPAEKTSDRSAIEADIAAYHGVTLV